MLGRVKRTVRRVARKALLLVRGAMLRVLRPAILRIDAHLQWLFDRQQDERTRLVHLEQQVIILQRQLSTMQRDAAREKSYAA